MLSERMLKALNGQIVKEVYSAYLYMSMAAYFEAQSLPGFSKWMRVQGQEESSHALIFFNYIVEQGARVRLGAVDAPPADFKSPAEVFQKTLAHEKQVTASIHALAELADKDKDYATRQFLDWFIKEQVEEEASASTMAEQLKRVGDGNAVFLLDKDAGTRTFVLPTPLTGKI